VDQHSSTWRANFFDVESMMSDRASPPVATLSVPSWPLMHSHSFAATSFWCCLGKA
jgi:hypothetical protein